MEEVVGGLEEGGVGEKAEITTREEETVDGGEERVKFSL